MTSKMTRRDTKQSPALHAAQVKDMAQDVYDRLLSEGFETRDIISVSTQLLGFASAQLAQQKASNGG